MNAFTDNAVQDAVDVATLAIEELADTLLAKGRFRSEGAPQGKFGEALDGAAKTVEPFESY